MQVPEVVVDLKFPACEPTFIASDPCAAKSDISASFSIASQVITRHGNCEMEGDLAIGPLYSVGSWILYLLVPAGA